MTTKLMIATPILGAPEAEFSTSLMNLAITLPANGVGVQIKQMMGESLVTRARNMLVHAFLKSDCTHLMFIDSDIVFQPADVLKLVGHNKPLVCGAYPKKRINWESVRDAALRGVPASQLAEAGGDIVLTLRGEDVATGGVDVDGELIEVLDVATGFMLVERSVFTAMATQMPELLIVSDGDATRGEPLFGFFLEMLEDGTKRHLSEDYAFSRRCQQIGIPCYVDATIKLGHVGRYQYRGSVDNLFEPVTSDVTNNEVVVDTENLDVDANPTGRVERLHIERYEWAAAQLWTIWHSDHHNIANAACGLGYGSGVLKEAFGPYADVFGYDISEAAIKIARDRYPGLDFWDNDIAMLNFASFDALVCIETLEHLDDPWRFLRKLRVDYLVLTTPIIPTKHRNPFHKWDFTKLEIDAALRTAGYRVRAYQQQCDDIGMWFANRESQ